MAGFERASARTTWKQRLVRWAKGIKGDVEAVYLAARHPRTPWYAKAVGTIVVGYALSPIDLIPDFVPVIGYLDDVILVPLGIALVLRLVPSDVMRECREVVRSSPPSAKPRVWAAAYAIVAVWAAMLYGVYRWVR